MIALRPGLDEHSVYPPIGAIEFFADQHKFVPQIYEVASTNTTARIAFVWTIFGLRRTPAILLVGFAPSHDADRPGRRPRC